MEFINHNVRRARRAVDSRLRQRGAVAQPEASGASAYALVNPPHPGIKIKTGRIPQILALIRGARPSVFAFLQ